jgi:hypothetical protein
MAALRQRQPIDRIWSNNIFLSLKLESKFKELSIHWPFFLSFALKIARKIGKKLNFDPESNLDWTLLR